MGEDDLETKVSILEQRIDDQTALLASLENQTGGGAIADSPHGQVVAEPKPITAFDVRKFDGSWKMYYPSGCLMCDGVAATGITPGADGYVAVEEGNVGIGITWAKNKTTKAVSNVVATLNQNMASTLTVSGTTDSYLITANFPVALKLDNEIRQVTSGFVSLTSDTGEKPNDGKLSVQFGTDAAVQKFSANTDQDATLEFAKVASTGSYNDLADKPTIPQPIQPKDGKLSVKFGTDAAVQKFSANTDQDATLEFAKVASTGSYNDLADKPTMPTIPDIIVDTTAVTSGKAIGGLTVDATNKHKIIASAVDIPAAQIQSDWNQTNSTAKDFIKNKPTIPAEQVNSDWNATSGKAQILNKPTIPSALQGSDYIDIPTTGTDAGKVKAKISPTSTDSHALVTMDTAQTITSTKTFSQHVQILNLAGNHSDRYLIVQNANNETRTYVANGDLYLDKNEGTSKIHFRNYNRNDFAQISFNHTSGNLTLLVLDGAGSAVKNKVKLNIAPNDETATNTLTVPTMGWVNDKFLRIANLVAGSNITITPDATNPKKLTIAANIPQPVSGTVPFVGDMRYDVTTHQLQKRVDTLNLATGAVTEGTWTMITGGQAVPHSGEGA